jgi:hypothetical protein
MASTDEKVTTERARAEERVRAIVEELDRSTLALLYKTLHDALGVSHRDRGHRHREAAPVIRWPTYPYVATTGPGGPGEASPSTTPRGWCPSRPTNPKPDDEPDDETDDEKDEEPDDESDDERDEEPAPGTLYFGEDGGRTAPSC